LSGKVLIVEDDPDLLAAEELLLEGAGYKVVTARDGLEALERISKEMPALILLDMRMPRMNGWEFVKALRSRFADIPPIVVITAAEDAGRRAAEIKANEFLNKPFEVQAVLDVVRRYVSVKNVT
jgi:CheY-like chemotaxis protein